jgi:hypothetical protein
MTAGDPRGRALMARVAQVEERLRRHAAQPPAGGLTDPDQPSGERWEYGQVWAHLGEFVPYWVEQARIVLDPANVEPVPFGRIKSDPIRVAAIERDRGLKAEQLLARISTQLDDLRDLIAGVPADGWQRQGLHQTLGVMPLPRIFEEFLVGHLEAHVAQLDALREASS